MSDQRKMVEDSLHAEHDGGCYARRRPGSSNLPITNGMIREDAWLGYNEYGHLVAIELEGFHAGQTIAAWEARGMRVEVMSKSEAVARWRTAFVLEG